MKNNISKIMKYFLFLSMPCLASATTLMYKGLNELVNEADGILAGCVIGVESYYDEGNDISTLIYVDVLDVIAGKYDIRKKEPFVVKQKGGKIDNKVYHIDGSPEFIEGDKVVLFLKDNGKSRVPFVGWDQGVYKEKYLKDKGIYGIVDAHGKVVRDVTENAILKDNGKFNIANSEDVFPGYQEDGKTIDPPVHMDKDEELNLSTQQFVEKIKNKVKSNKIKIDKELKSYDRYALKDDSPSKNQHDSPVINSVDKTMNNDLIINEDETVLPKKIKAAEEKLELQ